MHSLALGSDGAELHNREKRKNYAAPDYARGIRLLRNEQGGKKGILIEWGEVGIADSSVQTLLKIQAMGSKTQKITAGRIVFHSPCPREGLR